MLFLYLKLFLNLKVVRRPRKQTKVAKVHRNPLKKPALMIRLNPYAKVLRRAAVMASQKIVSGKTKQTSKTKTVKKAVVKK